MSELNEYYSCDDILLVPYNLPKEIQSRKQCDPSVGIYSLPLIASCMDTVYTKELDKCLIERKMMVWVHRYFRGPQEQLSAAYEPRSSEYRWFAVGKDREWINFLYSNEVRHFVVDMAHGDSDICEETVRYIKKLTGTKIIAGNVSTASGFKRLQAAGAVAVRVGVGSGCFVPETPVKTDRGMKRIEDIEIGDLVYTHKNRLQEVTHLINYNIDEEIYILNEKVKCTRNHEFLAVPKKYMTEVTDDNYLKFAVWKRADELTDDYCLIELD